MNNKSESIQQPNRPQEPKPPFPYHQEEVSYENASAGITLAATLTIPRVQQGAMVPAVVLIAGYGPHGRNATGMGHSYFLVLADYLTRHGIAVLRFDKRGVGQSTGNYATATTNDFADDVRAGVAYLKTRPDINPQQVGLIGLSEGGLIASIVAANVNEVAFAVLMAPAIITEADYHVRQAGLQLQADGASEEFIAHDRIVRTAVYSVVKQEADAGKAEVLLRDIIAQYVAEQSAAEKQEAEKLPFAFTLAKADGFIAAFNAPWYRFFLAYDPTTVLERIKVPVLVINGSLDWIASPHQVFAVVAKALEKAGNKDYTMIEIPNLNHVFQTCKTGSMMEYATIEETMSPIAMKSITDWILARVK